MSDIRSDEASTSASEKVLFLATLARQRAAVMAKLEGLDEERARWRPDERLISLLGIVNQWRWIDGGFRGAEVSRSEDEFHPGPALRVDDAVQAYRHRADATDSVIQSLDLDHRSGRDSWAQGHDLRWVVLHLITETARHAGHADATREMLDGTTTD